MKLLDNTEIFLATTYFYETAKQSFVDVSDSSTSLCHYYSAALLVSYWKGRRFFNGKECVVVVVAPAALCVKV